MISSPLVPTKKDRNDLFYFCTMNFSVHILRIFFLSTRSLYLWKLYIYITGKYLTKISPHHHIVFNASLSGVGFFPSHNKDLLVQKFYHLLVLQAWLYILLFSCSVRLLLLSFLFFWGGGRKQVEYGAPGMGKVYKMTVAPKKLCDTQKLEFEQ